MDVYALAEAHGREAGIEVELQRVSGVFILWELVKMDIAPTLEWRGRKEITMFHSTDDVRSNVRRVITDHVASRSEATNA